MYNILYRMFNKDTHSYNDGRKFIFIIAPTVLKR